MTPLRLPSRDALRPDGTENDAATSAEAAPPSNQHPNGSTTDFPSRSNGDLAHAPSTLKMADSAALESGTGQMLGKPLLEPSYRALLSGPWTVKSVTPIETLAESIVRSVRVALVVLDADLRVRFSNRAFCQTFQVSPDEIDGRWFPELGVGDHDAGRLRGQAVVPGP